MHKNIVKAILALGLLVTAPICAFSQQELLFHTLPDLLQNTAHNPAVFPKDKKIAVGVGAFSLDAAHSNGLAYQDVFVEQNGRTILDLGLFIEKLEPENTVFADQRIETVSLGFRLPGNMALQVGHANRLVADITYPKTLAELIWRGNAPYIGQTVEIGPQVNASNWNEWGIGLSKNWGGLSVGGRIKWLTGAGTLKTDSDRHQMSVYTDPDIYQLTLRTNYVLQSSGFLTAIDTTDLGFDLSFADVNGLSLFTQNAGLAFDLGAQWQLLGNKLTLDIGLLDLGGRIKWDKNAYKFDSQASYTYEGTSIPGRDIIDGNTDIDFDAKLDSLNDIFQFKKTAETFTTKLPLRTYIGGLYQITPQWTAGLTIFHQRNAARNQTAVGGSLRWKPLRWIGLSAMYSANDQSTANIGLGLTLTPGPVQLYFASDNLGNAFSPKNTAAVNFKTGLSLVF